MFAETQEVQLSAGFGFQNIVFEHNKEEWWDIGRLPAQSWEIFHINFKV